jgi:thiol-disulfide isomerase/thioredoxin
VFEDAEGGQHALSDFRGRFVLLHVWATWCAYCIKELPSLDALQSRFDPQKVVVIPLSADDKDGIVKPFYASLKLANLPLALDTAGRAQAAYRLPGLPSTVVIDPQGRELARVEGMTDWASPEAQGFLQNVMRNE